MKKIYFLLVSLVLIQTSCQQELTTLNSNPNNLESPDITTMTSNLIVSQFWNSTLEAWTLGNGMSQYVTFSQSYYNGPARYQPVTNEPYWIVCYSNARDAATVIAQAQKLNKIGNQAIAMTMQAFAFSELTNLWGDVPFKSALQGASGNYTVPYDDQQTVYNDPTNGILALLRNADALLKNNPTTVISGDLLYGGNLIKWRQFINSLRLRFLLRVSGKQDVSSEMQAIVNDGTIFQSSKDSGTLPLSSAGSYLFPSYLDRAGDFNIKYLNSILYNFYSSTGDQARLTTYFKPSANGSSSSTFDFANYGGMPVVSDATTAQVTSSSNFNSLFSPLSTYSSSAPTYARLITYAEVQFILAEAALKGYITGSAQTYYNNGVSGAYAELALPASAAAAYLANPGTAFNTTDNNAALTQIITQKWAANFNIGFEGWLEYRRTGIPALSASASLDNGLISNRFLYPTSEQTINSVNYNVELKKFTNSTEDTNYRAWW